MSPQLVAGRRSALVGVGRDQAGADRKAFAADEVSFDASSNDAFEDAAEDIMLAEALVASARECRVIGNPVLDAEAAKPAVSEVHLHLAAQRALRADREHVTEDEHPDHQLRINRRPAGVGIVRRQLGAHPREIENRRDPPDLMIVRHHRLQVERIEQLALFTLPPPHHRTAPSMAAVSADGITVRPPPQPVLQQKRPTSAMPWRQSKRMLFVGLYLPKLKLAASATEGRITLGRFCMISLIACYLLNHNAMRRLQTLLLAFEESLEVRRASIGSRFSGAAREEKRKDLTDFL